MKIAVNVRFLIKDKLEGIGWYTYQVIKRMVQNHPEHQFFLLFDRPYDKSFVFADNVTPIVVNPPARHPFLWYWWFEIAIPRVLKKIKPDLFISTDGFASLKTNCKTLLVIHDLAFEHYKTFIGPFTRKYYRHFTPQYARKADKIITVSNFSKDDIVQQYGIDPSKVAVIYNGVDRKVYQPINASNKLIVQNKYAAGHPYFIFVGSIHPRKNLKGLLQAFNLFKERNKNDLKLVVVGRKAWQVESTLAEYNNMLFKEAVIFLDHKGLDELGKIVAGAEASVYPSLFEGFGLPIIEAMSCGVPVITSNNSSMKEIGEGATMLIDPTSPESICNAMEKVIADEQLINNLIKAGNEKVKLFDWDKSAKALGEIAFYETFLNSKKEN